MELAIKLDSFEGPLDLLLHLIDKNKVSIYDIPIVMITEQYMEYLKAMKEADMDDITEFLVMAATLLDIKARMLLPKEVVEEEPEDPREELVRRLLEYKKYKCFAVDMRDMELGSEKLFYHGPDIPEEVAKYRPPVDLDGLLEGVSAEKLQRLFEEIIKRQTDLEDTVRSHFGQIERESLQIGDRLDYVKEKVRRPGRHSFRSILGAAASRLEVVVTFLAILELIKTGDIRLTDDSTRDDIILEDNAG